MVETERDPLESVADDALIRTHLANERTFLAWLRTAIVLIAAGVAAAALTDTDGFERAVAVAMGTASVLAGCLMVGFAYLEYRETIAQITTGSYRPANRLPVVATLLTAVVGVVALVFAAVEWSAD